MRYEAKFSSNSKIWFTADSDSDAIDYAEQYASNNHAAPVELISIYADGAEEDDITPEDWAEWDGEDWYAEDEDEYELAS